MFELLVDSDSLAYDGPCGSVFSCAEEVLEKGSCSETVLVGTGVLLAVSASVKEDKSVSEYDDKTSVNIACDDEVSSSSNRKVALVEDAQSSVSDQVSLAEVANAKPIEGAHSQMSVFALLG